MRFVSVPSCVLRSVPFVVEGQSAVGRFAFVAGRCRFLGFVALLAAVACGSEPGETSEGTQVGTPREASTRQVAPGPEDTLSAYDSSVCGEIDTAPYTDILGVVVPPLEVTTDSPALFRCRARTEELLVTVQFRADQAYWEGIPGRLGPQLDLEPLEAYAGTEMSGNLLVVRLEEPWTAVVLAGTQEQPDPTDAQLESVLRGLAALRGGD